MHFSPFLPQPVATYVLGKPHLSESLTCIHLPASLPVCGGTLRGESGTFTTPYYPAHYPPATDCVWNIEVRHILLLALNMVSNNLPIWDGLQMSLQKALPRGLESEMARRGFRTNVKGRRG